jgi:hypothetical protein
VGNPEVRVLDCKQNSAAVFFLHPSSMT